MNERDKESLPRTSAEVDGDRVDSHGDPQTLHIATRNDLIVAVPFLLGFHPEDSLVALGMAGAQSTCTVRLDLLSGEHFEDTAEQLAELLARNEVRQAALVGYGTSERVMPVTVATCNALAFAGIEVVEALRVQGDRFWCCLCRNPACCPPEGSTYDVSASPIASQATAAGHVPLASRRELERTVEPIRGAPRASMREATARAEQRILSQSRERSGKSRIDGLMVEEGVPYVQDVIQRVGPLGDDEVATLAVLLSNLRVRDEAWVRTETAHLDLWRDMLRRVEEPYVPAPACLTAYAAYLSGNGALANVALERASAVDPHYSMARLLRDMMRAGVPPSKARLRITPEELAAEYEQFDAGEQPPLPGDENSS